MIEQLSFLPPPPLNPKIPKQGSEHWRALAGLTDHSPLRPTHWLAEAESANWRMGAVVFDLRADGWEISNLQTGRKQAIYVLSLRCKQLFARIRNGAQP